MPKPVMLKAQVETILRWIELTRGGYKTLERSLDVRDYRDGEIRDFEFSYPDLLVPSEAVSFLVGRRLRTELEVDGTTSVLVGDDLTTTPVYFVNGIVLSRSGLAKRATGGRNFDYYLDEMDNKNIAWAVLVDRGDNYHIRLFDNDSRFKVVSPADLQRPVLV